MKKSIEAAVNILFKIVESLCKIVLVFMICTVTAQVVMRMFGKNIKWCEEVMLLLLDALMFLLMSVGIKEDLHISVEVFAKRFPQKARVAMVYISNIVLAGNFRLYDLLWQYSDEKNQLGIYHHRDSQKVSLSDYGYRRHSVLHCRCAEAFRYAADENDPAVHRRNG